MRTKTWEDGERIQARQEQARGLYLIRSGAVRLANVLSDGREVETARLAPGHWFGHISLLSGRPPPHEAFALGRSRIGMLPADRFQSMIRCDPELSSSLLRHLANNVHQLFEALDGLRSWSARAKVTQLILALEERQGHEGRIEIDHEALASQLGLTRVTVGKVLRDLVRSEAVRQGYGWIEIVDHDALGLD